MLDSLTTVELVEPVTISVEKLRKKIDFPENLLDSPIIVESVERATVPLKNGNWRFMDG